MTDEPGHTIKLYFEDNVAYDSLLTVTLDNWDGWAYRIARGDVKPLIKEFKKKGGAPNLFVDDSKNYNGYGVYFLFFNDEKTGKDAVYVGESEIVLLRLNQHIDAYNRGDDNEYPWVQAIAFISPSLDKTPIKYIENQLRSIISHEKLLICATDASSSREPQKPIKSSANRFIENIKILMPYLNDRVFLQKPISDSAYPSNDVFYIKTKTITAEGYISKNGFTVKAGAQVSSTTHNKSLNDGYNGKRFSLLSENIIDNTYKLTTDYEFSSASAAASILYGSNQDGMKIWKNSDKISLGDYLKKAAKDPEI